MERKKLYEDLAKHLHQDIIGAFFVLIKNKTPFNLAKSTIKIVTDSTYRFSRNPLYLSLLLLLFGIAVLRFSLWLFFTIPILYILFLFKAVKPEESYLAQKIWKRIFKHNSHSTLYDQYIIDIQNHSSYNY